jgi:hypothetical protein
VEDVREEEKNIEEARAIASLIKAAIEQPEYAGKTFGVITGVKQRSASRCHR